MAGLKLYTSNRLESLLDALASVVAQPLPSVFEKEVVVVQSKGMERWLSIGLAERFGVCMNYTFPFPNAFVWGVFRAVLHDIPDVSLYSPQVMTWRIMRLLPNCLEEEGFADIRNYARGEGNQLKRLQLSERIADVFDAYSVYRPEMVLRWDQGAHGEGYGERWQARLWRELFGEEGEKHRAGILREFLDHIRSGNIATKKLPTRVCVFGIPALPAYHLTVINALASLIDVHFFLLSPTREYWADIVPESRIGSGTNDLLHFEVGNSLLASMGKLGRDFFSMMVKGTYEEFPCFEEPEGESMLAHVQRDILDLVNRSGKEKIGIGDRDESIQIHSCHSPMREVEVLFDQLLHLFESLPGLTPKDIIVMTPDIETYAPYITAVFGTVQDDRTEIPFSIADRRAPSESNVIDTFMRIISLKGGRLAAPEVMDLLESQVVLDRFGFKADDIELITRWVTETRIYWGVDGAHRAGMDLPAFDDGTWKSGMSRLLLGYALKGDEERLFRNILPYDDVEGNETEVLGRFLEFQRELFSAVKELEAKRTLAGWAELLESLLARFFIEDEGNQRELEILRTTIRDLALKQTVSDFEEPIAIEVIRHYLSRQLKNEELSMGFLTGAVTFCEMLPMRSIPFEVVALIGMNSDAYPREYRPVGFDLIAHDPKPGDRSLRDEDRYLFLEAILSARKCLYISYVGQSIRDNSQLPPSVLVSELIDYLDGAFAFPESKKIVEAIICRHRLQPFSPAYFLGQEPLFSFSAEDCQAAKVNAEEKGPAKTPFISRPIQIPDSENREIGIEDLKRFFRNPSRYFLNRCLGIYLDEKSAVPDDCEPLDGINALEELKLKEWLTSKKMAGEDLRNWMPLVRVQGILPPATPGKALYEDISLLVDQFSEELKAHTGSERLPPLDVDIRCDGFRVVGRLENIWKSTLVEYRCAERDRVRDHLDVWVHHVILNCAGKAKYPRASIFARMGGAWFLNPLQDPIEELKKLCSLYFAGMTKPLKFFPKTSSKYAERMLRGRGHGEALKAARSDWEGSDFGWGEREDPYHKLCFGNMDPLDDDFAALALSVFEPLIRNRDKISKVKP